MRRFGMKNLNFLYFAAILGLSLSTSSAALSAQQASPSPQLNASTRTSVGVVSVTTLALGFGAAVDRARMAGSGETLVQIEARVGSALEEEIISTAAEPVQVQDALRQTLKDQRCVLTDVEARAWSRAGCASIDDLLTTVSLALAGPAATGTTGGIAGTAAGPPPVSAAGSDYADN